ncbi:MAG: hypothetical protein VZR73_09635, partial [Acutalibacteraceae bacterium]|nr:hypothetical protein [Acutalibacteraceae bacterium]
GVRRVGELAGDKAVRCLRSQLLGLRDGMGMYFIVAVVFRKAAAWVVGGVSFLLVAFLQLFRKMEFGWYNSLYESEVGRIIIGGPFEFRLFIYILIGMVLGAALELVLRQYNQIGLSD